MVMQRPGWDQLGTLERGVACVTYAHGYPSRRPGGRWRRLKFLLRWQVPLARGVFVGAAGVRLMAVGRPRSSLSKHNISYQTLPLALENQACGRTADAPRPRPRLAPDGTLAPKSAWY